LDESQALDYSGGGQFAVVSNAAIAPNETLIVFGGHVVTWAEWQELPKALQSYFYQVDDERLFGPSGLDDLTAGELINHSCNPNAGFSSVIHLVAMRSINADEQVTLDYAMWSSEDVDDWECECGETNCRKRIRGDDWTLPELRNRYRGYFQPYINAKIKELEESENLKCEPGLSEFSN
jgi:uncharacterized protein